MEIKTTKIKSDENKKRWK